jgi:hypothetical protein
VSIPAGATTSDDARPATAATNPVTVRATPIAPAHQTTTRSVRRVLHPAERSIPRSTRPPSSGSTGSRLRADNPRLTSTTIPATRCQPTASGTATATPPITSASTAEVTGPAAATAVSERAGTPSRSMSEQPPTKNTRTPDTGMDRTRATAT